jgi:hypothetical protein
MRRGKRDCIRQTDRLRQERRPEEGRGGLAGWLLGWGSAQAHWKRLGRSTDAFWIGDLLASSALSGRRTPPTQQRTSSLTDTTALPRLASSTASTPLGAPHLVQRRSPEQAKRSVCLSLPRQVHRVVHHLATATAPLLLLDGDLSVRRWQRRQAGQRREVEADSGTDIAGSVSLPRERTPGQGSWQHSSPPSGSSVSHRPV